MMYLISKVISALTIVSFTLISPEPCSESYELIVEVEGVVIKKGTLYVALYNNEEDFLETPFLTQKIQIEEFTKQLSFENLDPGEYAVTIYQDLNGNGKLDKMFKMPLEPYGLSNNSGSFPTFSNQKIEVNHNKTIVINIKN